MAEPFRLRVTFAKDGRLRWLSHLELARCLERLVRRSGLPYAVTQGFSPHMRISLGPALPVGTAGLNELSDVWLAAYLPPQAALALLKTAAGDTLLVKAAEYVSPKAKGLQATHTVNVYRLLVQANSLDAGGLQAALDAVYSSGSITILHKDKPKRFDLQRTVIDRPQVVALSAESASLISRDLAGWDWAGPDAEGCYLVECSLRSSDAGTLRPEQLVLAALAAPATGSADAEQSVAADGQVKLVVRTDLKPEGD